MKNFLSELIDSLTLSEKRYFKLSGTGVSKTKSSTKKSNSERIRKSKLDYHEVYNQFQKYGEQGGEKFQKSKDLTPSHFAVVKSYLYDLLLKSLRGFHEAASTERRIMNMIFNAKILEKKRLKNQALNILKKAEKSAEKYEYHYLLIEILRLKANLITRVGAENTTSLQEEIKAKQMLTLDKMREITEVRDLYMKGYLVYLKNREFEDDLTRLERIFEEKFSKNPNHNFKSLKAELDYLAFRGIVCSKREEHEKRKTIIEKVLRVYKENPNFRTEYFDRHIGAVNNYITGCVANKDFESISEAIEVLNRLSPKSNERCLKVEEYKIYAYLMKYMGSREYKKVIQMVSEPEDLVFLNKINPSRRMAFYFNFAQASFFTENYEVTNFWVEKIKAIKPREMRPDIRVRTEFLKVLVMLSKKEFSKIDKVINASKRVIRKYKTVGSEELFILENLKKITSNRILNKEILEAVNAQTDLITKWGELNFWAEKTT